jgi:sterol-4alpha-carboxylate 3-dehydrogenase (decarboxylating)
MSEKKSQAAVQPKLSLGKVLVIGGNGFLGHHVVNQLLTTWTAEVSVIDLVCTRNRRPDSDGVQYFEADITDAEKVQSIFNKIRPDVVIHTASPAPQSDSKSADGLYKKVNVDGTKCIIEAAQLSGVKALVYTSSASILSDNASDLINADERWPVIRGEAQTEYYSETKVHSRCPQSSKNKTLDFNLARLEFLKFLSVENGLRTWGAEC